MTKKGLRTFDCRSAVSTMSVEPGDRGSRIDVLLRHGVPSVRPDDVLTGLRQVAELETTAGGVLLTRVAQGPLLEDGTIGDPRSEEHTSELQSLMRISYAVFCLKKKKKQKKPVE